MTDRAQMRISFRRTPNNPNLFEFTITTPLLRSQFRIPRALVNQLRVDLEKVLTKR
jgi:hypothetical protein